MTRILIFDHDRQAAKRLAGLLRLSEPALQSATADTPEGAALVAAELGVQLVLIDLGADPAEGAEAARRIAANCEDRAPVLVAIAADPQSARCAVEEELFDHTLCKPLRIAGLLGLLDQTCAPEQPMVDGIRSVTTGAASET